MTTVRPSPFRPSTVRLTTERPTTVRLADGAADLLLGGACVTCRSPGAAVCGPCLAALPLVAEHRRPTPCPPGLAPAWSSAVYDGVVRDLVIAHKERGVRSLAPVLGAQLALAVSTALSEVGVLLGPPAGQVTALPLAPVPLAPAPLVPVLLVPVPSRSAAVRQRGHDATVGMCRAAARQLTRAGLPARCLPLLRLRRGVADQAGLDRAERAANLGGSMVVRGRAASALIGSGKAGSAPVCLVVCDDVMTTGSTAREAQRALEAAGLAPAAVATVAAAVRRRAPTGRPAQPGRPSQPRQPAPGGESRGAPFRPEGRGTNVTPWSPSGSVVAPS